MKILLAGPGTGKTTKIKSIIREKGDGLNVLILSFTNATVKDLLESLSDIGVSNNNCMTLHKFAVKYNHDRSRHILIPKEVEVLEKISKGSGIDFFDLCNFLNCTTFDQMIDRFVSFAKSNKEYLRENLTGFDSMIIDEYQDFNPHEQALIDVLVEAIQDVYILGDDDQCIYDFKNASSEKLINLHNNGNNEQIDHEHCCYRCPDIVVHHASKLIKKNLNRVDKKWEKTGKVGILTYRQLHAIDDVAQYILDEILKINGNGQDESILILSPVKFVTEKVADKITDSGINFINCFTGNIPEEFINKAWKLRILFGDYKYLNLVLMGYGVLPNRKKFYEIIKRHYDKGFDFDELYNYLSDRLQIEIKNGYGIEEYLNEDDFISLLELYNNSKGDTDTEKLENLFRAIEEAEDEKIKIMSIHKSKGLGADHVFLIGLNEGIIPNKKKGNDSIEAQRRLFYVGMTRAKKNLHLISNLEIDGKYARTVNFEDFKYNYRSKSYLGKASTFIEELELTI